MSLFSMWVQGLTKDSFRRQVISLYCMSETYPCKVCRETFSKACRLKNQQKTHSGEKPYPCTVCHRHIPVKNVVRHFLKHVVLGINKRLIHESLQVFSCCEVLTTVFTRETKMTSPHDSLQVFSCCVVFTTFFTRETKIFKFKC